MPWAYCLTLVQRTYDIFVGEFERISYSTCVIGATILAKSIFTNTGDDGVTKFIFGRRNGELTVIQL